MNIRLSTVLPYLLCMLITFGCGDGENDPIVIDNPVSGGGNDDDDDDDDDEDDNNGGEDSCSFEGIDSEFTSCLSLFDDGQLNVATWNIEFFPKAGNTTISEVINIVENLNADVIAVQEINDLDEFETLGNSLFGWEARVVDVGGDLHLGYLYKSCEITSFEAPDDILNGDVEPRPAVATKIQHTNGTEVTLLNIHLKASGGEENEERRRNASIALKNYIDEDLSDEKVIVLGDWNDDILPGSPFDNFLEDTQNYAFADQEIAEAPSSDWSYPSWPSHLDHILITNELFDMLESSYVVKLESCVDDYDGDVSDHRIVLANFNDDL